MTPAFAARLRLPKSKELERWLPVVADTLLNRVHLIVAGEPYRLAEIEVFLHGPEHADPFAHRNPIQHEFGRWYFHKTGGSYRGGTFKGLDLTLGDDKSTCGILFRSVVLPNGTLIDGPCLVVDHLLAKTGVRSVAELDERIGGLRAWDRSAPVAIRRSNFRNDVVYSTARIGLSLKRSFLKPDGPRFIGQSYRFLTEPRRIRKGKPHLVVALSSQGCGTDGIRKITGVPARAVFRYLDAFESGRLLSNFEEFLEQDLDSGLLCRLVGACSTHYPVAQ